jgi:S-(hydroxymethyl)glutathione dehydrogenase/alcohol dehydrogenase
MKTRTAVLWNVPGKWHVTEVDLDPPKSDELLVRMEAAGLCHSDDHMATGDLPVPVLPFAGGHEGCGVVEDVGPGVRVIRPGDRIVTAFVPACGRCLWCAQGAQNLCDSGAGLLAGAQLDGSYRVHVGGRDVAQNGYISTFSEYTVMPVTSCIVVPPDIPAASACLLACAVPTGFGSATNAAQIAPGDVVIVMGVGGIGINAVQGARHAGAAHVLAVDPVEFKRTSALEFGASEAFESIHEAAERARALTNGQGANAAIVTVGVARSEDIGAAFATVSKGGTVVVTSATSSTAQGIPINLLELAMYQKRIQGALYGMGSPHREVPRLIELYLSGSLKIDELVTRTYSLDQINEGYDDMRVGRNLRGVISFG